MHIVFRIALWLLAGLVVLLLGSYAYLRNADLSVYEAQIEAFLSENVGHKVDIDGRFELHFGNVTSVHAEDVTVTNTAWPSQPVILSVGQLSLSVELWSLFRGPVVIQELAVQNVSFNLERDDQGTGNWETAGAEAAGGPRASFDPGDFVAFRQIRIRNVRLHLDDPARRRPLNVVLDYLTVTPDSANLLDLDLRASINDMPLRAGGKLGPWTNLIDGRDIQAHLSLSLGDGSLSIEGHIADLFNLEGIETSVKLHGPSIDSVIEALGIPPFAEGEFEVTASIDAEDTGTRVELDGNLGEITIFASGNIEKFINPGHANIDFNFAGPDAKYVAEVFGLENVTQAPFQVSGRFDMQGRRYALSNTEARFATGVLGIDGWIDLSRPVPDVDVTINSSGPDLSAIGVFSGITGIPAEAFEWQGRIQKIGAAWRFDDFNIKIGANRIGISGELDPSNEAADQIDVTVSGPDISILQEIAGLQGIPARPFDVSVRLKPDDAGLRIEDAVGVFGDNRVEVDGVLGLRNSLQDTDLSIRFSGPELHHVALLTGVPYLPTGPFTFAGRALIDNGTLTIENATAKVTGIDATVDGTIGLASAGGDFDLQLSARGPDLAGLAEIEFIKQFSGEAFDISGRLSSVSGDLAVDSLRATVGSLRATIDGEYAGDGSAYDFRITADAPNADVFEDLAQIRQLPEGPVVVRGRVRKIDDGLEFSDTEFRIGDHQFSVDGTLSNSPMSNDSDLRFTLSGPELRQLGLAFGIAVLPAKTYSMSGEINGVPTGFAMENFVARLGENDIVAKFTADLRGKPEITGTISSTYVDLESEMLQSSEESDQEAETADNEFLFSDEPLDTSWLHAVNIDIDITAGRAILRRADVHDVHVHIRLWDGKLAIDPLEFAELNGSVAAQIHLEPAGDGLMLDATLSVENMHVGLKTSPDQDRTLLPPLGGQFEIRGSGKSLHEIMASSNGKVDFRHGAGLWEATFLSAYLGDMLTEIIRAINPMSKKQTHINLECGIYDIDITDGIATINDVIIQSDRLTILASGSVNFINEKLDVAMRSKPREGFGISLGGVINSFLKLGGTLQKPGLNIDATSSVTTTGVAVATGGLSLLARGLWDRVTAEADLCAEQE